MIPKEIDGTDMIQILINNKFKNMKYWRKRERKQDKRKYNNQIQEIWMMNLKIMELENIKHK